MAIVIIDEACRRHGDRHCRRAECEIKLSYRRERVEDLLRAKWNDGALFKEERPEPDMAWRKGQGNDPKRSTDIWAEQIDLDKAWDAALMEPGWREALHMHYGDGLVQRQIGPLLGVSHTTISRWLYAGINELMFQLNGRMPAKDEEESEEE